MKEYNKRNRDQINENQKRYQKKSRPRINIYEKNRKKTDLNYKLACNLRSRTSSAFKSQNIRKINKTFDLLGCSFSFLRLWIESQLYGEMTLEIYGIIWCLDHCLAVASFNLSDGIEKKKCFNWINLRPLYVKDNLTKGDKIDYHLYLLQEIKGNYFMKLNVPAG